MVSEIQYWDWYKLFVNDIAGSSTMFIVLSFTLILFLCAKFRFPNSATIMIMGVYGIIISAFFGSVLIIAMFVMGTFFALALNRILSST